MQLKFSGLNIVGDWPVEMLLANILRPEPSRCYIDWFSLKAISEESLQFSNFTCEQESIFSSTLGLKFADQELNQGVLFTGHWIWSTAGL